MDKARPTIVHVITESTPFGGAQRHTLLMLQGLRRDGYPVELICGPGGPLVDEAAALGIPVHVIQPLVRPVDPIQDGRALVALSQLFRLRRYHIVHTHSTKAGILGRLAAWWTGIPGIVHTVHGVPFVIDGYWRSRLYLVLERLVGAKTHRMICVGEVQRQEIAAWKIAPAEKLVTIYSGIDFAAYVPRRSAIETQRELELGEAWPIVGCIGRLCAQKAQHDLIEAIALLRAKYPRIKLLLVGDGELRPLLDAQIRRLDLAANVTLLGERQQVADLLNVFDVYAMSSLWEGVGRALTEAMYWGLPIVATRVNGVPELIQDGETGLLVSPHQPQALAMAIERLLSDHALARRLGSSAQRKAQELLDAERMVRAIQKVYAELC